MNRHYVYIHFSNSLNKYYIGESKNYLDRLEKHNEIQNNGFTKRGQPWQIVKVFEVENRTIALKVEKFIKGGFKLQIQFIRQKIKIK